MTLFSKYISLETGLSLYLGIWNATIPLLILTHGSMLDLTIYEIALAVTAVFVMPLLAVKTERMDRILALRIGCVILCITSVLRAFLLLGHYSFFLLTVIDIMSVCAFAMVQPLLSVYPAETVSVGQIAKAFCIRRICAIIARLTGPLLAAAALLLCAPTVIFFIAAFICMITTGFLIRFPRSPVKTVPKPRSIRQHLHEISLGLRLKWALPPERFFSFANISLNIVAAATIPLITPTVIRINALPNASAGVFNAVFAAGAVLGVLFFGRVMVNAKHQRRTFVGLWVGLAAMLSWLTQTSHYQVFALTLFGSGALVATLSLIGVDRHAISVSPGVRIRLAAASLMLGQLSSIASFLIIGPLISQYGLSRMWMLYCALAGCLIFLAMKTRSAWHFLEDDETVGTYYERFYPLLARRFFS